MSKPKKRPRPTLSEARSGHIASIVDTLVDCYPGTAAARITRMDRHQLELVVMHLVRSVDPRWRFTKPLPLPSSSPSRRPTACTGHDARRSQVLQFAFRRAHT